MAPCERGIVAIFGLADKATVDGRASARVGRTAPIAAPPNHLPLALPPGLLISDPVASARACVYEITPEIARGRICGGYPSTNTRERNREADRSRIGRCAGHGLGTFSELAANYRRGRGMYPRPYQEVYKPLIDYLSHTTGHRFQLVVSRNYHTYWRDSEQQPGGLAFDDPHFVDFRIQRFGFVPVARNAQPTVYALLGQPELGQCPPDRHAGCLHALSQPRFRAVGEMYGNNPLAQPDIRSEAISWRDGVEMVFAGEVQGAMVPGYLAETYYNLPTLARTRPLPGKAFTASPKVPAEDVASVAKALETLHEDAALYDVLGELGAPRFEPATAAEYAGLEKILSGFYGYRTAPKPGQGAAVEAEAADGN